MGRRGRRTRRGAMPLVDEEGSARRVRDTEKRRTVGLSDAKRFGCSPFSPRQGFRTCQVRIWLRCAHLQREGGSPPRRSTGEVGKGGVVVRLAAVPRPPVATTESCFLCVSAAPCPIPNHGTSSPRRRRISEEALPRSHGGWQLAGGGARRTTRDPLTWSNLVRSPEFDSWSAIRFDGRGRLTPAPFSEAPWLRGHLFSSCA